MALLNNRYQIIQALGTGGFGVTFLAEDTQMPSHRRCVIKQLKPVTNDPKVYQLVQERFQREAAVLEELGESHHQIPKLFAYFSVAGQFYLVEEWIEGETLTQRLERQGKLKEDAVKEILLNILPVLDYVHKRIIHRDIKPDNIILRKRDGLPVLIDFGAVKEIMSTVLTTGGNPTTSIVIGTPGFMASEQSVGRPVYSSDLFSLGLTAIYLLTGKIPQDLQTDYNTGEIIWRSHAVGVSKNFADILDKAIKYHPRDRFPTASAMLNSLQPNPTPIPSPQPTVPSSPKPGLVDWQKAVFTGGVIGTFVLGSLWLTKAKSPEPTSTPSVAQQPSFPSSYPTSSSILKSYPSITPSNSFPSTSTTPNTTWPTYQPRTTTPTIWPTYQPRTTTPSTIWPTSTPSTKLSLRTWPTNGLSTSSISQQEAVRLVRKWLRAKRVMFAPPYNYNLGAELTTGDLYQKTVGTDGSISWLVNNGAYYRYGTQRIDGVNLFQANNNNARIHVIVTEERTLYKRDGSIDPNETDYKSRLVRYDLQNENGKWKIWAYQTIRTLMVY